MPFSRSSSFFSGKGVHQEGNSVSGYYLWTTAIRMPVTTLSLYDTVGTPPLLAILVSFFFVVRVLSSDRLRYLSWNSPTSKLVAKGIGFRRLLLCRSWFRSFVSSASSTEPRGVVFYCQGSSQTLMEAPRYDFQVAWDTIS